MSIRTYTLTDIDVDRIGDASLSEGDVFPMIVVHDDKERGKHGVVILGGGRLVDVHGWTAADHKREAEAQERADSPVAVEDPAKARKPRSKASSSTSRETARKGK